ncbi:peptidylprolyl isomerase fpr4 [Steccherinum ochraceum]|uniref:Peptidylprolyl isomerase fpr4 n=1 Tax=Steccherinum ochraceum TaxID=92696 RepID=A0A4R0RGB2_9APHY|nr:peptidylprolyl isomerase fpr4 [Steccherinum ochraceum]
MTTSISVWRLVLQPGSTTLVIPPADLKITNIALGKNVADESARTTIELSFHNLAAKAAMDGSHERITTTLGTLIYHKAEQHSLDLALDVSQSYWFTSFGPNVVYITGYLVYVHRTPQVSSSDAVSDLLDLNDDKRDSQAESSKTAKMNETSDSKGVSGYLSDLTKMSSSSPSLPKKNSSSSPIVQQSLKRKLFAEDPDSYNPGVATPAAKRPRREGGPQAEPSSSHGYQERQTRSRSQLSSPAKASPLNKRAPKRQHPPSDDDDDYDDEASRKSKGKGKAKQK